MTNYSDTYDSELFEGVNVLDYAKVLEMAEKAVQERGADYTYSTEGFKVFPSYFDGAEPVAPESSNSCYYVHADESGVKSPGCIVGKMFIDGEVWTYEKALRKEGNIVGSLVYDTDSMKFWTREDVLDYTGIWVTPAAKEFLRELQSGQDARKTWGEALASAKSHVYYRYRIGQVDLVKA